MFKIKLADLVIQINHRYPYVQRQCSAYLCEEAEFSPDMIAGADEEELEKEYLEGSKCFPYGYCESICIYRNIARNLLPYQAFLFHASVIEVDGKAYAFSAKSGTGKTTHTNLWLKKFGNRARIINGDKPIIRFCDGTYIAYGTPWCGKEKQGVNDKAPLAGICFLERGEQNAIHRAEAKEIIGKLFQQVLLPEQEAEMIRFFEMMDQMIRELPCYVMQCTISEEAAAMAYEYMST